MRKVRRRLPLLGVFLGPLPLVVNFAVQTSGVPYSPAPPYLLYGTLLVSVLFLAYWWRGVRAENGHTPAGRTTLWAVVVLAAFSGAFGFSYMSGYAADELRSGETYGLLSTVLVSAGVGVSQALLAAVVLVARGGGRRVLHRGVAAVAALAVIVGLGAVAEHTTRSLRSPFHHVTTGTDRAPLEVPARIGGAVHTLDIPEGDVWGLHAISSGALWELGDGVMAVDPRTGDELWRYRHPGAGARVWVAPDMETVVVEVHLPWDGEDTGLGTVRVTLDAGSGRILHTVEDRQRLLGDKLSAVASEVPPVEGEGVVVWTGTMPVLQVFGASSGALLWEFHETPECVPDTSHGTYVINSPAATQEQVFVPVRCLDADGGSFPGTAIVVHAFEAATGELQWTHEVEDSDEAVAGIVTASSDGSLLYRYEHRLRAYFTIDTATGREISTGQWEEPGLHGDTWDGVLGDGVLLGTDRVLTLTDAHGAPAHTLELPEVEGNAPWSMSVTDEVLYTAEREGRAWPVTLTAHPWDGSAPDVVENVLGRALLPDEWLRVRAVPGAVVVYTGRSGSRTITSAVGVT